MLLCSAKTNQRVHKFPYKPFRSNRNKNRKCLKSDNDGMSRMQNPTQSNIFHKTSRISKFDLS